MTSQATATPVLPNAAIHIPPAINDGAPKEPELPVPLPMTPSPVRVQTPMRSPVIDVQAPKEASPKLNSPVATPGRVPLLLRQLQSHNQPGLREIETPPSLQRTRTFRNRNYKS